MNFQGSEADWIRQASSPRLVRALRHGERPSLSQGEAGTLSTHRPSRGRDSGGGGGGQAEAEVEAGRVGGLSDPLCLSVGVTACALRLCNFVWETCAVFYYARCHCSCCCCCLLPPLLLLMIDVSINVPELKSKNYSELGRVHWYRPLGESVNVFV